MVKNCSVCSIFTQSFKSRTKFGLRLLPDFLGNYLLSFLFFIYKHNIKRKTKWNKFFPVWEEIAGQVYLEKDIIMQMLRHWEIKTIAVVRTASKTDTSNFVPCSHCFINSKTLYKHVNKFFIVTVLRRKNLIEIENEKRRTKITPMTRKTLFPWKSTFYSLITKRRYV